MTTAESKAEVVFVTGEEIATLNAARDALDDIASRAYMGHDSQASGMVRAAADSGVGVLFSVLNIARSYGGQEITDDALHNRHEGDA